MGAQRIATTLHTGLAIVALTAGVLVASPAAAVDSDVVPVSAKLEECINTDTDSPGEAVTVARLEALVSLNCDGFRWNGTGGIDDLSGLEHAVNLEQFWLQGDEGNGDLAPLAGLSKLARLSIESFGTTDVTPLAGIASLRFLSITNDPIGDPAPLAGLVDLELFSLANTALIQTPDISRMTKLVELYVPFNGLTTPPDTTNKPALRYVSVFSNQLTELPDFTGSPAVISVALYNNRISDISGLASLPALKQAFLSGNAITDLSPLPTDRLEWVVAINQRVELPPTSVGVGTPLPPVVDVRGDAVPVTADGSPVVGSVTGGVVIWNGPGDAAARWATETALPLNGWTTAFTGTFTQHVEQSITPGTVRIAGSPRIGRTLTAAPGTWSPGPVPLTYQWNRNGVPIPGATGSTYALGWRDLASRITVTVTGTKDGYPSVARTSPPTARVWPRV